MKWSQLPIHFRPLIGPPNNTHLWLARGPPCTLINVICFYFLLWWNTSYVKRYLVLFPTIKESQIQASYFPETKTWQWKFDHLSRCHFLLNFRDFPASHGKIQGSSKLIFSWTTKIANPRSCHISFIGPGTSGRFEFSRAVAACR